MKSEAPVDGRMNSSFKSLFSQQMRRVRWHCIYSFVYIEFSFQRTVLCKKHECQRNKARFCANHSLFITDLCKGNLCPMFFDTSSKVFV